MAEDPPEAETKDEDLNNKSSTYHSETIFRDVYPHRLLPVSPPRIYRSRHCSPPRSSFTHQ